MNVPKKIIDQAKAKARAHTNAVKTLIETDGDWDDRQADPFDAWLTVERYDLNVVGDPSYDPITWNVLLYRPIKGETDAEGYWETDYSNYVTLEL
tara:strand:- start:199 stop:483 length:285 start_codon:yes stop_codon:yes gene_type:complete